MNSSRLIKFLWISSLSWLSYPAYADSCLSSQNYIEMLRAEDSETFWDNPEKLFENVCKDSENLNAAHSYLYDLWSEQLHSADSVFHGRKWESLLSLLARIHTLLPSENSQNSIEGLFRIYLCHGHALIRVVSGDTDIKLGFYPFGSTLLYLPGKVHPEDMYYDNSVLETCPRLVSPMQKKQIEELLKSIEEYEQKQRYNVFFSNCVDFGQACFHKLHPDAGWFSKHMPKLDVYSFEGAFDKSVFAALVFGQGLSPALYRFLYPESLEPDSLSTIFVGAPANPDQSFNFNYELRNPIRSMLDLFVRYVLGR